MKKSVIFIVLWLFILNCSTPFKVYAKDPPPSVSADSAVLLDATTGKILFSKNPDSAYPPASTTKVMTALIVLEKANLDSEVTIGTNPPKIDGTRLGLIEGEKFKVRDLLYGLLLASDNDCAMALAEYVGNGSVNKFVDEMNKKAIELGAVHTHFVNPSGLFDKEHKTSAKDLSLIMEKLSKNSEYSKIASTLSYNIKPTNKWKNERVIWNENKLIQKQSNFYYDGCIGGKTGYTIQSLHSYVATAVRGNHQLIVALVHDKNKTFFPDAISLFNYGYNNFKFEKLYSKGDIVTTYNKNNLSVPLIAASDFYYNKEIGDNSTPTFKLKNETLNSKYFKKGDVVNSAEIFLNGKSIGNLQLLSGLNNKPSSLYARTQNQMLHINIQYLILGSIIILILVSVLIIRKIKISHE